MSVNKVSVAFILVLSTLLLVCESVAAQQEKVLYSLPAGNLGGWGSFASMAFDSKGNLYGTAAYGGPQNAGTVFELKQSADGTWPGTTLHTFGYLPDGQRPQAGVFVDPSGNLYGTTTSGGAFGASDGGEGTAFELTPASNGTWTETILHSFGSSSTDGFSPGGPFIADAAGNLYGATSDGGPNLDGTVFVLAPKTGGGWTEKNIYDQGMGGLVFDSAGNLYGVGTLGDFGTVLKLTPNGDGSWRHETLYTFNRTDGYEPSGTLAVDAEGNIYGETFYGGTGTACQYNCGLVFELVRGSDGRYTEKILHNFQNGEDGAGPRGSVILDAAGNVYGVTYTGGNGANCITYLGEGCGTVFELSPTANGWREKILHVFTWDGIDGANPLAGLIFDTAGNLYGTTYAGGANYGGVVFEITP
jgi:hypothetical protein